jgi:hypothetical protein
VLEFSRGADRLLAEWKGDQNPQLLDVALMKMKQAGAPDESLLKPFARLKHAAKKGYDSIAFAEKMEAFHAPYRKWRRHYLLDLRNQEMRNVLELVYPFIAAQARSRGFQPENPLMLSCRISKLVKGEDTGSLNELRKFKTLADLWERYFTRKKEGQSTKKTFAKIKQLRRELRAGYQTKKQK